MISIKRLVATTYQKKHRNMRSKIPKITNQLENIKNIKHHLYLQNRIEIQVNTSKDTGMALVNNRENSIKISTTEHLTKSTNHKTSNEWLNSTPAKGITEEITVESFYKSFDKKDQNVSTEALKKKVTNQTSEAQNDRKEEVDQNAKKIEGSSIHSWR